MFKKLSEKPVAEVQNEQVAKWKEEDLLKKCVDAREGETPFVFYEGPPTANGKPGIHHVMARTLKDSVCRYKTMQGFQVNRKAGWDTHGLPVGIAPELTPVPMDIALVFEDDREEISGYEVPGEVPDAEEWSGFEVDRAVEPYAVAGKSRGVFMIQITVKRDGNASG